MPAFLLFLLAIAVLGAMGYFYYQVAVVAVTEFLVPVSSFGIPGSGLLGAMTAVGVAAAAFLNARTSFAEVTVTPDEVARGAVAIPGLRRRDSAWPHYLVRQLWLDLGAALRRFAVVLEIMGLLGAVTRRAASYEPWLTIGVVLLGWPLFVVVAGVLLAFLIGLITGILGLVSLFTALGLTLAVLWSAVAVAARGTDRLARKLLRANGTCPRCHRYATLPGFRCSGPRCTAVHWDLRPGPLGVWSRRCDCGELLPTTVFRAARRLRGVCPNPQCLSPLRRGSHTVPDIRLPVVGARSAGKTSLTYAGLLAMSDRTRFGGGEFSFVDSESERLFELGSAIVRSATVMPKTGPDRLPAVTVRISASRWSLLSPARKALLHLYDAAGDSYENWQLNELIEFLDHATGLVFVLDPFTIPRIRDEADSLLEKAVPSQLGTMESYELTIQRLRKFRVPTERLPLAVAVTKADLVGTLPAAVDLRPGSGPVRDWLNRAGLDHLVTASERDFGVVRYFLLSSVSGCTADHPLSAAAPLEWLIERGGVTLPGGVRRDGRDT